MAPHPLPVRHVLLNLYQRVLLRFKAMQDFGNDDADETLVIEMPSCELSPEWKKELRDDIKKTGSRANRAKFSILVKDEYWVKTCDEYLLNGDTFRHILQQEILDYFHGRTDLSWSECPFWSMPEQEAAASYVQDKVMATDGYSFHEMTAGSKVDRIYKEKVSDLYGLGIQNKSMMVFSREMGTLLMRNFKTSGEVTVPTDKYCMEVCILTAMRKPSLHEYARLLDTRNKRDGPVRFDGEFMIVLSPGNTGNTNSIPATAEGRDDMYGPGHLQIADNPFYERDRKAFVDTVRKIMASGTLPLQSFESALLRIDPGAVNTIGKESVQVRKFSALLRANSHGEFYKLEGNRSDTGYSDVNLTTKYGTIMGFQFKTGTPEKRKKLFHIKMRDNDDDRIFTLADAVDTPWFLIWCPTVIYMVPSVVIVERWGARQTGVISPTHRFWQQYAYKKDCSMDMTRLFERVHERPNVA